MRALLNSTQQVNALAADALPPLWWRDVALHFGLSSFTPANARRANDRGFINDIQEIRAALLRSARNIGRVIESRNFDMLDGPLIQAITEEMAYDKSFWSSGTGVMASLAVVNTAVVQRRLEPWHPLLVEKLNARPKPRWQKSVVVHAAPEISAEAYFLNRLVSSSVVSGHIFIDGSGAVTQLLDVSLPARAVVMDDKLRLASSAHPNLSAIHVVLGSTSDFREVVYRGVPSLHWMPTAQQASSLHRLLSRLSPVFGFRDSSFPKSWDWLMTADEIACMSGVCGDHHVSARCDSMRHRWSHLETQLRKIAESEEADALFS
jgi:hypothetical protein